MQSFYQFLESSEPVGFVGSLFLPAKPNLDSTTMWEHIEDPIKSFITEFLKWCNLFVGPEPVIHHEANPSCTVKSILDKHSDKPKKLFFTPATSMKTAVLLNKLIRRNSMIIGEDYDIYVFDYNGAQNLFRSYFKQLTGLKTYRWVQYWSVIESGIECIISDFFKDRKYKPIKLMPKNIEMGGLPVIGYKFGRDESLEERILLTAEFNELYKNFSEVSPPFITFQNQELPELEQKMSQSLTQNSTNQNFVRNIHKLEDLLSTAKIKKAGILIRKIMPTGSE